MMPGENEQMCRCSSHFVISAIPVKSAFFGVFDVFSAIDVFGISRRCSTFSAFCGVFRLFRHFGVSSDGGQTNIKRATMRTGLCLYVYAYAIELLAPDGCSSTEEDCAAFLERGKK